MDDETEKTQYMTCDAQSINFHYKDCEPNSILLLC